MVWTVSNVMSEKLFNTNNLYVINCFAGLFIRSSRLRFKDLFMRATLSNKHYLLGAAVEIFVKSKWNYHFVSEHAYIWPVLRGLNNGHIPTVRGLLFKDLNLTCTMKSELYVCISNFIKLMNVNLNINTFGTSIYTYVNKCAFKYM